MKRLTSMLLGGALVAFVAAGCSQDQAPTGAENTGANGVAPLKAAPGNGRIPGQYIVVLKEGTSHVPEVANEMARMHGLAVEHVYESAIKGYSATIPAARLEALRRDDRIEYIEEDQEISIDAQTLPWGISAVGADSSSQWSGNGSGAVTNVRIYIIDSGIQPNHPDLNVVGGRNFVGRDVTAYADGNGHGTHVAGTAAGKDDESYVVGVAPGAPLYAVRVLGNSGSGSTSGVIAGVDWVRQQKLANPSVPMVANMSLGGGVSTSLDNAVNNCINAGVVMCVAAGNEGDLASNHSPARVAAAITVGAYDSMNRLASWSNYGSVVDISAPGVNVLSDYKGTRTATMSGTSMACPHVAGAAALYLSSNPGASPATVRNAIVNDGNTWLVTTRANTTNKVLNVLLY